MAFVNKVEEDLPISSNADQFLLVKHFLNAIEPETMFRSINNPVEWQKELRDEWKAR